MLGLGSTKNLQLKKEWRNFSREILYLICRISNPLECKSSVTESSRLYLEEINHMAFLCTLSRASMLVLVKGSQMMQAYSDLGLMRVLYAKLFTSWGACLSLW